MPARIAWLPEMDQAIRDQRAAGASWETTAAVVGVEIKSCIRRAKVLGVHGGRISIGPISGYEVVAGRRPNMATLHRPKPRSDRWETL